MESKKTCTIHCSQGEAVDLIGEGCAPRVQQTTRGATYDPMVKPETAQVSHSITMHCASISILRAFQGPPLPPPPNATISDNESIQPLVPHRS